jgi:hypothetical protein
MTLKEEDADHTVQNSKKEKSAPESIHRKSSIYLSAHCFFFLKERKSPPIPTYP